uniref:Cytochrome P450 71AT96 n=1 Tax=Reynoutria sachalinensis TaxID=76036 RepID=A0A140JTH9_9CARY|nr:cytochrome P450 71AT96 [Fallopia sachalinensis]
MHLFLQLLLILVLVISLLFLIQKTRKDVTKQPPGPPRLPLIGNLHQFPSSCPHLWLHELSKKYGPLIFLKLGFISTLVVSSARMAKQVMKTQDQTFCSRPSLAAQRKLSYNALDVVFAPYGGCWKQLKKICVLHLFSSKKVQSFSSVRQEEVCEMMKEISRLSGEGRVVDLSEMMMSLTCTVICRIAFGKRYDGVTSRCRWSFRDLLKDAQVMLATLSFSDYFPGMGWIDKLTGMSARLDKVFMELNNFYEEIIEEHLNTIEPMAKSGQEDIVDVLLKLQREGSLGFDITTDHIKAILMNIIVGATETTTATVVWVMTELMRNPEAMKRLQEETRTFMMRKKTSDMMIKGEDFEKLVYLKAVVKETMRLHPAAPLLIPRETIGKCVIEGYEIQEKTLVFVNAWAIGRDPEFWENPEEFTPERFLSDKAVDFRGQDFELIPFGSGRRICPGMQMGLAMVELALVNLIGLFDWALPAGMEEENLDLNMLPGIAVHKEIPLRLIAMKFCC